MPFGDRGRTVTPNPAEQWHAPGVDPTEAAHELNWLIHATDRRIAELDAELLQVDGEIARLEGLLPSQGQER